MKVHTRKIQPIASNMLLIGLSRIHPAQNPQILGNYNCFSAPDVIRVILLEVSACLD